MKKLLATIFCFIIVISFVGCGTKNQDTVLSNSSIPEKIKLTKIVDLTEVNQLSTDAALELFYKDSDFNYYFPSIKSMYIECQFSDGSKIIFTDALENEKVSVSDLDTYGIQYWMMDKDGNYINSLDKTNGKYSGGMI